jgi:hypothetical protein
MRALIGALMLALVVAGSTPALACDDDEIEFIAVDGSLIKMRSGATFHVISSDQLDASMWLAMDDVLICKDDRDHQQGSRGRACYGKAPAPLEHDPEKWMPVFR